ncbi:F0F1 ATP synthase subunit epsilon [Tumidithrix elongata RA019]|uniref:F0F1 ATP synthase subunit epsilon n=1 Tax=Tumidithrix elongata BACA0141 TaxID=2716417 RepID=A0AAW9Q891_9CYAN|nr:F0F1 ATP synthase subunit epsilon [Tumidithrix elongata RA019]
MLLKIILPTKILLETEVSKVVAEAENGSFCLLPRHVDFVAILVPSLLSFIPEEGKEQFWAVDEGILIKQEDTVTVSTQHAVKGEDLGMLRQTIAQQFRAFSDREKTARSVLAKLEISTIRRFIELGEFL